MATNRVPDGNGGITPSTLTVTGDTLYASAAQTPARLPVGSTNQVLGVTGGIPAWQASPQSTLTATGDVLYASAANTPARLGIGSASQVLTVSGGIPSWQTVAAAGVTWAAYTPTFTEMTFGNATYTARSATSGKLVYFYIKFTLGSTTTFSTYPAFTLPTQPSYAQSFYGASKDYSAGIDYAMYFNNNGTDAICYIGGLRRPTTYVETQFAANVPMTWAVSDYFYVTGAYEIA